MALTDNLVSLYGLAEASGNALDAVSGFTATETGGTITSSGGGRLFAAVDTEWFERADEATQSAPGNVSFAMIGWFNAASNPGDSTILAKGDGSSFEYLLQLASAGGNLTPTLKVCSGGGFANVTSVAWGSPVATGGLHFLYADYNTTTSKLRISLDNGTLVEAGYALGSYDSAAPLLIGGYNAFGQFFDGILRSVGLWVGRVLDATERTTLYNAGTPLPYSSYGAGSGVTLTAPIADKGYRLTTLTGATSVGTIPIVGTNVSGVTHDFEASLTGTSGTGVAFDGTAYTTIATGVLNNGAISSSLTGVPYGEYLVTVRATTDHAVTVSVLRVTVGLVVMEIGQSNPHRFMNNQLKKLVGGATHSAFRKDATWGSLLDPTGSGSTAYTATMVDSGTAGSALVPAADYCRNRHGLSIIWVPRNVGGGGWPPRVPTGNHTDTATYYGVFNVDATLVGGINFWWAWLGETDGVDGRDQALVFADIEDVHDAFWADQAAAGVLTLLPNSDVAPADLLEVNNAIQQAADTLAHIAGLVDLRSPVLLDCNSADGDGSYHVVTDGGAVYCGTLIGEALAVAAGFSTAAGGGGCPLVGAGGLAY